MNPDKSSSSNPLCSTLIFLFGTLVGAYLVHNEHRTVLQDILVIGVAVTAFHFTQTKSLGLFLKNK